MGDKISQLPAATTVDGTELVPIVQGGATKKVTGAILRSPTGVAGGDLTGTFPNPTLAAVTTAQIGVGSGSAIPVLTVDEKGRVTSLTTAANPALTTAQIAGLTTSTPAALSTTPTAGLSTSAARADHAHLMPSAADVGALGATAAAGGDLVGNFPNPTLAAVTTAQINVGSGTQIPVLSVDAKGRVTGLSSVPAAASTAAITALTGDVTAAGPGSAAATLAAITTAQSNVGSGTLIPVLSIDEKGRVTALSSTPVGSSAGGTVTSITAGTGLDGGTITSSGTISLASLTTAQSNVGSASQVPVLSINAQGQVTSLSSVAVSGVSLATTAPSSLSVSPVVGTSVAAARADHQHQFPTASEVGALPANSAAGGDLTGNFPAPTLAAVTTAQSNVGSSTVVPVLSVDAKGRVTSLTTAAISALTTAQIAGLSTDAPAPLATTAFAGLSTFAARADHQHVLPTASEVGALGATATASGDLTGNYPGPTLAAITTAQSNVGSSTIVPVLSVDAKGRVTSLTTAAIQATSTSAITSLTGDVIAAGPGAAAATLQAITTAQSNVGSASQVPILSIDAKGRVISLSSTPAVTSANATQIQGRNVASTLPLANQALVWNNTSSQWEPNYVGSYAIEYLLIAGGGSGGSAGGGGGGGVLTGSLAVTSLTVYPVVIGAGGSSGTGSTFIGNSGNNSTAFGATALGGGGGGQWSTSQNNRDGLPGGSGGGAGLNSVGSANAGGAGTSGQGFAGGNANQASSTGFAAGGGGGAGAVGGSKNNQVSGAGGAGVLNSINGSALYWAGGGGGGSQINPTTPGNGGIGGGGGGANGNGGTNTSTGGGTALNSGGNGTTAGSGLGGIGGNGGTNTGGGGGAMAISIGTSGSGASGIVILRYLGEQRGSGGTVTSAGGYTIHTFTTSGNFTA